MTKIDAKQMTFYFDSIDNQILSIANAIQILSVEHNDQISNEIIRRYCLYTSIPEMQRICLEFLYMNGYYDDLQKLIAKNKESMNDINQQWAHVFQISIDRRNNRKESRMFQERLNQIITDDPELRCLIELTRVALYYDQSDFSYFGNFLAIQPDLFSQVQDDYLLSSYTLRLYQYYFLYYWSQNNVIIARKYAFRVLNKTSSASTKASINVNLGLTYMFDTYQQGMHHLNEALKISKHHGLDHIYKSVIQNNIPFLSAHFKQLDGITSEVKSEQAHIEIAKGNNKKAIAILKDIPIDTPFKLYYLGLAKQDEAILEQSYSDFIKKRSDYFCSRLPFNALNNLRNEQKTRELY